MRSGNIIAIIIPVLNEEKSIGKVLDGIPSWVDDIIVVDNGSTDETSSIIGQHGGRVVFEPRRGYGSACLAGIKKLDNPDIVVFMDGDYSDYPEEMDLLVDPVIRGEADLVIGSRVKGEREPGSLTLQSLFGNWLATTLIRIFWKTRYTDLGPFRAIRYSALKKLEMLDKNYGWTIEMQIKAAKHGYVVKEAPVSYRCRIGQSKISNTVTGALAAGIKILFTIFNHAIKSGFNNNVKNHVIVFTRYPKPGTTKTRLIPEVGAEEAARLHSVMVSQVVNTVRILSKTSNVSVEIRFEGGNVKLMQEWLGPDIKYYSQANGNLGDRMVNAVLELRSRHFEKIIIVGTDTPQICIHHFENTFNLLNNNDLVFGPAIDGGYYLIGLKNRLPEQTIFSLFDNIGWGENTVLADSIENARKLGLSWSLLEPLNDVDRVSDLHVLNKVNRTISVIIPTLNESNNISKTLETAARGKNIEIIVVDGGSSDDTRQLVKTHGAKLVKESLGRAKQLNTGSEHATGDILLFLHADTLLPENFDGYVRQSLARPGTIAGAFLLHIGSSCGSFRIIESLANFRSKYLHLPYGDQAIFIYRDTFLKLGGFPEIPIMDDFQFVKQLNKEGSVTIVPVPVITSARRWLSKGILKTTLVNQLIILGYFLGVPPDRLETWYNS